MTGFLCQSTWRWQRADFTGRELQASEAPGEFYFYGPDDSEMSPKEGFGGATASFALCSWLLVWRLSENVPGVLHETLPRTLCQDLHSHTPLSRYPRFEEVVHQGECGRVTRDKALRLRVGGKDETTPSGKVGDCAALSSPGSGAVLLARFGQGKYCRWGKRDWGEGVGRVGGHVCESVGRRLTSGSCPRSPGCRPCSAPLYICLLSSAAPWRNTRTILCSSTCCASMHGAASAENGSGKILWCPWHL